MWGRPHEFSPVAVNTGRSILAVGRLVPKKGFDILLRALPAIPDAKLTLVGDGPEGPSLRQLAAELQVADRVHFAGALANSGVRERMADAALFVLPCREASDGDRDGIPVVLMVLHRIWAWYRLPAPIYTRT
ncbi:MAG: glycosyltransferase [Proteobacteria bacterium]|nr:glycosyltransferase [Pseudomonadota bacterium]